MKPNIKLSWLRLDDFYYTIFLLIAFLLVLPACLIQAQNNFHSSDLIKTPINHIDGWNNNLYKPTSNWDKKPLSVKIAYGSSAVAGFFAGFYYLGAKSNIRKQRNLRNEFLYTNENFSLEQLETYNSKREELVEKANRKMAKYDKLLPTSGLLFLVGFSIDLF
jgi:hypothetical protein